MMQQSYDLIVSKIADATKLSLGDIEKKVAAKLAELQDLISREGAAHIVANELGVQLFDSAPKVLKIKDISPGMNAVTLTGKILTVYEPRSFTSGQRTGRVANLILGDETGSIKVVFWDENLISEFSKFKEGDVLKIKNAYAKQNNTFSEVHLGSKAQILINPENEIVSEVKTTPSRPALQRKKLSELVENEFAEVFATIVQIFEPKFYNACPVCSKKVFPQDAAFNCQEHGLVTPKSVPIVNIFIDDSSGNLRAVCFRDQAEKLIGKELKPFEEIKRDVSGRQVLVKGKLVKNAMFNRSEFVVSSLEEADPEKLIVEMENM